MGDTTWCYVDYGALLLDLTHCIIYKVVRAFKVLAILYLMHSVQFSKAAIWVKSINEIINKYIKQCVLCHENSHGPLSACLQFNPNGVLFVAFFWCIVNHNMVYSCNYQLCSNDPVLYIC